VHHFFRTIAAVAIGLASLLWVGAASATPTTGLVISEIMFEPIGSNNQKQWVELYNRSGADIDLSTFSLGWGRTDYTQGVYQLAGVIPDGATWVVGGPVSSTDNGSPTYQQPLDFTPNLRPGNNNARTDGIALFDVVATSITPTLAPIHAVIYGLSSASTLLIDESGAVGTSLYATDGGFPEGSSIEFFNMDNWALQSTPTAGSVPASVPEPGTAMLLAMGLVMMRMRRAEPRSIA
jgi:hypothetical protein